MAGTEAKGRFQNGAEGLWHVSAAGSITGRLRNSRHPDRGDGNTVF